MIEAAEYESLEQHMGSLDRPGLVHVVGQIVSGRRSLAALIEVAGWRVLAHASLSEFFTHPQLGEGCLVLDACLLGLDGCGAAQFDMLEQIELPTILIGRSDVSAAVRAIKAGATAFLAKPISAWALLDAIDEASAIGSAVCKERLHLRRLRERFSSLSQRERQVMMLVAQGRLNKQVGGDLGISEITVKAHRGQAMRKMGARSFAELVNMAATLTAYASLAGRSDRNARGRYDGVGATIVH